MGQPGTESGLQAIRATFAQNERCRAPIVDIGKVTCFDARAWVAALQTGIFDEKKQVRVPGLRLT